MPYRKRIIRQWDEDELTRRGTRPSEEWGDDESDEAPFVKIARSLIGTVHDAIQRIGDAVIGPDFTGNARGAGAFDLQSSRSAATQVASGANSVAFGQYNTASGAGSVALGQSNEATAAEAVALGNTATATAEQAAALGSSANATAAEALAIGAYTAASATYATAIGSRALARKQNTVNISGPLVLRSSSSIADPTEAGGWIQYFSSGEVVISTPEIDLKTVTDHTITLPTGVKLFLNECGLILTTLTGLVAQPTVRFGVTGTLAASLAAQATTALTATGIRERYLPLNRGTGVTSITFGITVAANATTMKGRAYWIGVLVENET